MKSERYLHDADNNGVQRRNSDKSARSSKVRAAIRSALTFSLLFAVILIGLVLSKGCILSVTSRLRPDSRENVDAKSGWIYLILIAACIPYIATFLHSGLILRVGLHAWPSPRMIVTTLATEAVHCFGMSLLLFRVLPELDVVRGLLTMSAFGVAPAAANMAAPRLRGGRTSRRRSELVLLDALALLGQLSAVATFISCPERELIIWELPAAIVCVTLSYGWNFYNDQVHAGKLRELSRTEPKTELYDCRTVLAFLAQPVKVGFMCYFTFALFGSDLRPVVSALAAVIRLYSQESAAVSLSSRAYTPVEVLSLTRPSEVVTAAAYSGDANSVWITSWLPFLALIVAPLLVFYASTLSTRMQSIAFSWATVLATPAAVIVAACLSSKENGDSNLERLGLLPTSVRDESFILHIFLGTTWWLSQLWISRHTWIPKGSRIKGTVRVVSAPTYCAVLLESCLVYNSQREGRRRVITRAAGTEEDKGQQSASGSTGSPHSDVVPMIYICATMWHENEKEMMQMLTSIVRLDEDQATLNHAHKLLQLCEPNVAFVDRNYYNFEAHVFFDDVMELNENDEWTINSFARTFVTLVDRAVSSVFNRQIALQAPVKSPTPYGGRLTWTLPGGNQLIVHLKDKNKVRHRKRWSQVMYMYYLLGHQLLGQTDADDVESQVKTQTAQPMPFFKSKPLCQLPEDVQVRATHTFCLALDGDVDFQPQAVHLLIDRMRRSRKAGVVCGRIHPIGAGPIVWYQKFEYAISHWLQKAAEDVLGCVLCAPGAFSLFRASALMEDNVMGTYVRLATEARHYVQYDQGEDRWLTTLLLQQGYRVEYVAGADALTYAPESFGEFFNQRRRWTPSTMAHTLDLLLSWRNTVYANTDMSLPFITYQAFVFLSWLLAPATVILMVAGALNNMFEMSVECSLIVASAVPAFFIVICFTTKSKTQISVAAVLSVASIFLMIALLVATLAQFAQRSPVSFWGLFVMLQWVVFVTAALLHPKELLCLFHGLLYYLCVISGYVLLVIYSMVNLHEVSWGTRETVKRRKASRNATDYPADRSVDQGVRGGGAKIGKYLEQVIERSITKRSLIGWIATLLGKIFTCSFLDIKGSTKNAYNKVFSGKLRSSLSQLPQKLSLHELVNQDLSMDDLAKNAKMDSSSNLEVSRPDTVVSRWDCAGEETIGNREIPELEEWDDLLNPAWMGEACLRHCPVALLPNDEINFWNGLIASYLKPLDDDMAHQARITMELKTLRNYVCLIFIIVNAMWIVLVFLFQLKSDPVRAFVIQLQYSPGGKNVAVEPISLAFLTASALILVVQYICMLRHRWLTFTHLLEKNLLELPSVTAVRCCSQTARQVSSPTLVRWDTQDAEQIMRDAICATRCMHRARYAASEDDENNNSNKRSRLPSGVSSDTSRAVSLGQETLSHFTLKAQFVKGLEKMLNVTEKQRSLVEDSNLTCPEINSMAMHSYRRRATPDNIDNKCDSALLLDQGANFMSNNLVLDKPCQPTVVSILQETRTNAFNHSRK